MIDSPRGSAWERAGAEGVHRLSIPTPFAIGRVNSYLIEDSPLTLVDSGPNSARALNELQQGLAARGHAIEDLELLVVTHQHMDHLGLLDVLARRSGAQVAALDLLAPYLEAYAEHADREDGFAQALMLAHGVPADVVSVLRAVSGAFRAWGSSARVDRRLHPGDRLDLRDRTFEVLHRPGHSPTDTVLWDPHRSLLLCGDHLIEHVSSNPLISLPPGAETAAVTGPGRPRALVAYLESLRATRELPATLVLPGHGEPIEHHARLIDERLRLHERRARKILGLIRERPRTAYEIAQEMWGNIAATQAYLTLSEVLGHVDLLLAEGKLRETEDAAGGLRLEPLP